MRHKSILERQKEKRLIYTRNNFRLESHVPVEWIVSTLLWPHLVIADELHVLQYARYYSVLEMLNVDKMEHWCSSGVQKNAIVLNINWIYHKNGQIIYKASETLPTFIINW